MKYFGGYVPRWLFFGVFLFFLSAHWAFVHGVALSEPLSETFRIGFSRGMFTDVNENDARAAIKVWGETIAEERGVPADPDPAIFKDMDEMLRSLREKRVDAVGITSTEYAAIRREIVFSPIFATYNAGRATERYVLLAHRDGLVKKLADIGGRSLRLQENPRACLAPLWLDTLLVRQGYEPAGRFAGTVSRDEKLSQVVLPVFFRQADACVVTRSGFDTMCELNPQLAKQLDILAESEEMVPAVFAFRSDYSPTFMEKIVSNLNELDKTPAGRQVLIIFHSEKIVEEPASILESALELIETYERLAPGNQSP
jgi:ABC-type phosphate/phosphonate transport system substrate-binding protein